MVTKSNPHDPRTRPMPLDEQIAASIKSGFETVLTDMRAIMIESREAQREIAVSQQATAQMMGKMSESFTKSAGLKAHPVAPKKEDHQRPQSSVALGYQQTPHEEAAHRLRQETLDLSASDRHDSGRNQSNQSTGAQVEDRDQTGALLPFQGVGGELPGSHTRGSIRERIFNHFDGRAEKWAYRPLAKEGAGFLTDKNGQIQKYNTNEVNVDAHGRLHSPHGPNGAAGKFLKAADVLTPLNEKEQRSINRRSSMANVGMNAVEMWKNGEGTGAVLKSLLPAGLVEGATGVGAAVMAADAAWTTTQHEIGKAREMQGVYGGSTMDGFKERGDQWFNKNIRGRFSTLGPENYDKLFGQAMDLGMRGGARDKYIGTAAGIMNHGVDAQQTGEILSIALKSAQGLSGLAKSIKEVGDVAREAGVNGHEARKIFTDNYKAASEVLFGAPGAAKAAATAFTESTVQLGNAYAGKVDYSGTMSYNVSSANAASAGLTQSQYATQQHRDPTFGMAIGESRVKDALNRMLSTKGQIKFEDAVKQFLSENPNFDPGTQTVALGEYVIEAGFTARQISDVLRAAGIAVSSEEEAPGIAAMLFTQYSASQIAIRNSKKQAAKYTAPAASPKTGTAIGLDISKLFGVESNSWAPTLDKAYTKMGSTMINGNKTAVSVASQQMSPVVQELLNGQYGLDPKSMVSINTANGPMAMTLADALKNYQAEIPSATLLSGDYKGTTVQKLLNLDPTTMAGVPKAKDVPLTGLGTDSSQVSMKQYREKEAADLAKVKPTAGTQTVTIDLKPYAKALLDQYVNGKLVPS